VYAATSLSLSLGWKEVDGLEYENLNFIHSGNRPVLLFSNVFYAFRYCLSTL